MDSVENGAAVAGDYGASLGGLEQETLIPWLHQFFFRRNSSCAQQPESKWLVAAVFFIMFLLRHDVETLWATSGGVLNACLSIVLKNILNHERPVPTLRSDPGMPSSHAQSIFYTVAFCIISIVKYFGFNGITVVTSALIIAMGSYFIVAVVGAAGSCVGFLLHVIRNWVHDDSSISNLVTTGRQD